MFPFHSSGDAVVCNPGTLVLGRREFEENQGADQELSRAESYIN